MTHPLACSLSHAGNESRKAPPGKMDIDCLKKLLQLTKLLSQRVPCMYKYGANLRAFPVKRIDLLHEVHATF